MRALSSRPFCPCDGRWVSLGYLSAGCRYTADQSVRLFIGAPLTRPERFFSIDDHADHAQIESGTRFPRVSRDTFSCPFFNNLRNLGDIWQCGIISIRPKSLAAFSALSGNPGAL